MLPKASPTSRQPLLGSNARSKKQEATTTQTSYRPSLNMTLCGNRHTCGRERLGARRRRRVQQLGLLGRLVARTAVTASAA